MSSYVHVFLRSPHNDFIQVAEGSRNSRLYALLGTVAPYGGITNLSKEKIKTILDTIKEDEKEYSLTFEKNLHHQELIATFNNSISDKITAIKDIDRDNMDLQYDIEENMSAKSLLYTLLDVIEFADYNFEYHTSSTKAVVDEGAETEAEEEDDEIVGVDEHIPPLPGNQVVYVGIECGPTPTIDDIV